VGTGGAVTESVDGLDLPASPLTGASPSPALDMKEIKMGSKR
jgi:hypothetical protein